MSGIPGLDKKMNYFRKLKYKNLTLLILCLLIVYVLSQWPPFMKWLESLKNLGLLGAFLGGLVFVFTFTVAIGGLILYTLSDSYPIWVLAVVAGLGAMAGDFIIFQFVKVRLFREVELIYKELGGGHLTKLLHTKYFRWTLPLLGAILVASPLPDEIGVTLMGLSKMKTLRFTLLSAVLNMAGIFLLLAGISLFK